MAVTANPRLKSQDMLANVFFDSIGSRVGLNTDPVLIQSRLLFTNPANVGVQLGTSPGGELPFLSLGNPFGTQVAAFGLQLSGTGEFTNAAYNNVFPVGRGSGKVYNIFNGLTSNAVIVNESTVALINAALPIGISFVSIGFSSPPGTIVVFLGANGIGILTTATDGIAIVGAGGYYLTGVLADDESFMLAFNITSGFIELRTTSGFLTASYPVPGGANIAALYNVNRLALDNGGVNGYLVHSDGTDTFLVKFNAVTGIAISSLFIGTTSDQDNPQVVVDHASSRAFVRWNAGANLTLVDSSGVMSVLLTKSNLGGYRTPSGTPVTNTRNSILKLNDARTVLYVTGNQPQSGLLSILTKTSLLTQQQIAISSKFSVGRTEAVLPTFGVFSSDGMRAFFGNNTSTSNSLFVAGTVLNKVKFGTIEPLNGSGIFLNGSLAISEYGSVYANTIYPAGGNPTGNTGGKEGVVSIPSLHFDQLFGNGTLGTGTETFTFRADLVMNYPHTATFGFESLFGGIATFNSAADFTAGFNADGALNLIGSTYATGPFTIAPGLTATINRDIEFYFQTIILGQLFSYVSPIESIDYQGLGANAAIMTLGIDVQGGLVSSTTGPLQLQGFSSIQALSNLDVSSIQLVTVVGNIALVPTADVSSTKRFFTPDDLECTTASSLAGGAAGDRGLVLKSNDGNRWVVTVSNAGALLVFPAPQAAPV